MNQTITAAVLGNCTTDYIVKALGRACEGVGISAEIYECPFNQYNQAVYDPDSAFYRAHPELTILFLEGVNLFPAWYEARTVLDTREKKEARVQSVLDTLILLTEEIHSRSDTKIVLNNFRLPFVSPLGILDHKFYPGLKDMVALLNLRLSEWASQKEYLYIFDYCAFAAHYGEVSLGDAKLYYILNSTISLRHTAELAREYLRYILPLKSRTKKCLVLDLDHTLWGGVAGEDGLSGIKLDITGPGRSFRDFQKEILNLHDKGVLLAVCSKNNPEDVMEIFERHPHMVLKKEHFSVLKINWQDKASNLREIARELNIGTDSLVFFDDSVVERELVKSMLPEVTVIDVPADTGRYPETIRNLIEFELLALTAEDLRRNEMYAGNQKRAGEQQKYATVEEYLKSLRTKVILEPASEYSIPRIAQLTQKTNQFNMTTKRYTPEEIKRFQNAPDALVFSCQVTDIYGDNGITGVCIVKLEGDAARIDTFLLSCRVLGRNVEFAFLNRIVTLLWGRGIRVVRASFCRTEKNRSNAEFYARAGFSPEAERGEETEFTLFAPGRLREPEEIEVCMKGDSNYG